MYKYVKVGVDVRTDDSVVWGFERGVGYGYFKHVYYEVKMSKVESVWMLMAV